MEVETKEEDQTHPQVNVEDNLPSPEEVNTMDSKDEEIVQNLFECLERSGK